jgi:SAM-dependent methyltransferase
MKLNLGCGNVIKEGYINLDLYNEKADIKHDLNIFPYPFKDNTFDEILSEGCIEELDNFRKVIEEIYRILKPNGILKVWTSIYPSRLVFYHPNTKKIMTYNSFDAYTKEEDFMLKIRFKIVEKKFVFSVRKELRWVSWLINLAPNWYNHFLLHLLPCDYAWFELEKR